MTSQDHVGAGMMKCVVAGVSISAQLSKPPSHPQESFRTEEMGWVVRDGVVVVIKDSNIADGTVI
jgi:hypothetical protein